MNSEHLKDMVDAEVIPGWVAQKLDRLSTEDKKTQAAEKLQGVLEEAVDRLCEEVEHPPGKLLYPSGNGDTLPAPHGRIKTALHSIEKFAAWDILGDLEAWMSVQVPPYRYVRRVFSWLCTAFSVETMLAIMISLAMLYGCYRLASAGVKWGWRQYSQLSPRQSVSRGPSMDSPLTAAGNDVKAGVPIPHITSAQLVAGNKLMLHWETAGDGVTYQVFSNCHPEDPNYRPQAVADHSVSGSGAVVDIHYDARCVNPSVYVMGFSAAGVPSELSDPVIFHLSLVNKTDSVEPIAITPTAASGQAAAKKATRAPHPPSVGPHAITQNTSTIRYESQSKPGFLSNMARHLVQNSDSLIAAAIPMAPVAEGINVAKNAALAAQDETKSTQASAVPVPAGLQWRLDDDQWVNFTWTSIGPGYRYNYYSAIAGEPNSYEIENNAPLTANQTHWRPYDRTRTYWIVVTAVDASGHESARSNYVEVKFQ